MTTKPQNAHKLVSASVAPANVLGLTIASNLISSSSSGVNPYSVRNELLTRKTKARVRYQNGSTLPTSAELLLAKMPNDATTTIVARCPGTS